MRSSARPWFWGLACAASVAAVGCSFPEYSGFEHPAADGGPGTSAGGNAGMGGGAAGSSGGTSASGSAGTGGGSAAGSSGGTSAGGSAGTGGGSGSAGTGGAGGSAGTGGAGGSAGTGGAGGPIDQGGSSGTAGVPDATAVEDASDGGFHASEDATVETGPVACDDLEGGAPDGGCDDAAAPETDLQVCARLGKSCGGLTAWDACGRCHVIASCGTCTAPQSCGGGAVPGVCGCAPESDAVFCSRLFKNCGAVTANDNCGISRTVASCGICSGTGVSCGGGGTPNVCACNDENDAAFCLRLSKNCGTVTANDKCGVSRTVVSCGTCSGTGVTCGGGGTPNVCGCTGETDASLCSRLAKNCGALTANDNCAASRTVASCGTCSGQGETCAGGGTANVCGCSPETDSAFCLRLNKNCDSLTANDNCGSSRTVASCGTCSGAGVTCGGSGVANVCGCAPETDATLCSRLLKNCGSLTANDNCGTSRTAASCGTCAAPQTCAGGGTANVCGGGTYDINVPFVVDDQGFVPGQNDGTWGDWSALAGGSCNQRAGAQGGNCHKWTYTYNATGGKDCNGVALVPPATACTWTTEAWKLPATVTKTIAPGATKIQFYAWGNGTVTFGGAGQPALMVALTAAPTQYTVNITTPYAGVNNVFTIGFTSAYSGTVVNVDDIRWVL